MAINFTVSYTFSPSTTISSSQVNTNFSDEANVWTGLEAGTKSFSQLKVDADPTSALQVATKQYVDHYSAIRRPVLKFVSVSTVDAESGLDGTSGDVPVQFPDGILRTATTTTMYRFDITRNAVLTSSGGQSGLRTSLSESGNTWYALYAVAFTDTTTGWVLVGDTVLPVQSSFSTLNSNFGANKWVYLGLIRNGSDGGNTADIINFLMAGNMTYFIGSNNGGSVGVAANGIRLNDTAGATTLTYTYSAGTSNTAIPSIITFGYYLGEFGAVATSHILQDSSGTRTYIQGNTSNAIAVEYIWMPVTEGVKLSNGGGSSITYDIAFAGFVDGVLGVGSNPLL